MSRARRRPVVLAGPEALEPTLGVTVHPDLLQRALTHRSYAYENGGLPTNERLEFLGDSVLGPGGHRHAVPHATPTCPRVSWPSCAPRSSTCARSPTSAATLGLGDFLRLGRGEEATGGRDKSSILADTRRGGHRRRLPRPGARGRRRAGPPAVRPADRRGGRARRRPGLEDQPAGAHGRARRSACPSTSSTESGPDHEKFFTARVRVGGAAYGDGHRAAARRRPSSRPAVDARDARASTARATPGAGRARPCPSCPRSRSSAAAWTAWVVGRDVADVEVLHPRAVRRHVAGRRRLRSRGCAGRTLVGASRRGKYLWLAARRPRRGPRRATSA